MFQWQQFSKIKTTLQSNIHQGFPWIEEIPRECRNVRRETGRKTLKNGGGLQVVSSALQHIGSTNSHYIYLNASKLQEIPGYVLMILKCRDYKSCIVITSLSWFLMAILHQSCTADVKCQVHSIQLQKHVLLNPIAERKTHSLEHNLCERHNG